MMWLGLNNYSSKQIIGLLVISSLLLIENIDAHILNVAIPQLANAFNTSVFTIKLAVTAYLIGLAIFIPISGWVANRFGAKNTLIFSITLFTTMSMACGMANSIAWLVVCRLLQGLAGAFMVPVGSLLLLKIFDKSELVKTYTLMSIPVMFGPIMAPILGGYLVTYFSWNYIFWINLPIGALALYATLRYVDNYYEVQQAFNFRNFIFLALFLFCLSFWLDICLDEDIKTWIKYSLFLGSILFGAIYANLEHKSNFPVIRYHLFKLRVFRRCFIGTGILRAALGGRLFLLAVFLEVAFHLNALHAGFFFIFMSVGVLSSRTFVRFFIEKFGFKVTLTCANLCSVAVFMSLATMDTANWLVAVIMFLNGVFTTAQFMCFNILFYDEVESSDYASAVSLTATWHQLGLSFGVIVSATILHLLGESDHKQLSISSFHYAFIASALINLSCQLVINGLQDGDGSSLTKKRV